MNALQKSAQEQFDVQMVDREDQWVERGQSIIANFLDEAIERRIFRETEAEQIKARITGVGTENVAKDNDLVDRGCFRRLRYQTAVFATLDEVCDEHTILASNTSSLSVIFWPKRLVDQIASLVCISFTIQPKIG